MLTQKDFLIKTLGECTVPSPLQFSIVRGDGLVDFVPDNMRVRYSIDLDADKETTNLSFEKAGPRSMIFFQPNSVTAAIMTSGGLCPGLNNVIRSLVMELYYRYKVNHILGIRYGHKGLDPSFGYEPIELIPKVIKRIHDVGGSYLGTSRGTVDKEVMIDSLNRYNINILFGIGGDGSQKGLYQLYQAAEKRRLKISFIGIPKTIDNDIPYAYKTFGLDTAVTVACQAIKSAHNESESAYNGIGLVKVMGRNSGYIAALSAIANNDVNFCLVPEVDFDLDGDGGFFEVLADRLKKRHHAVIVVAEGAGQKFFNHKNQEVDPSGNIIFNDIGIFIKEKIKAHFNKKGIPINLKYIEPSYMLRSVPTNANDSIYTDELARHAVHAGMAGKTAMMIGNWYNILTHVPLALVTSENKRLNIEGEIWRNVLSATGQPMSLTNKSKK